ncbi:hypothetical protein [Olleya sp. 1-3]|uniref:hypothetical protein n=1 Tax=Olleya sp. 1-3 TaxID=2058323 RepID=UPI000C342734|nr:hypothetical protein [Olleya sp. 1-3]PKG52928.1 hypothetical protein CXF54_03910 [Olleya sp. 1-3]
MSKREQILKEILSDKELMVKYDINEKDLDDIKPFQPGSKKIVDILSTIINENDNNRSSRQIYSTIKNIHKI